jgi:8-oxo-dGTP pyrophosphatase MutT (NUDIX family)
MELNHETVTSPPVDAATVLLLRDSDIGLQVLLLRRHHASKVLGGAYVFPGGKLDAQDQVPEVLQHLHEPLGSLHQRLAEPALSLERSAGLFVAALREALEECGVLPGQPNDVPWLPDLRQRLQQGQDWASALDATQARLHTHAILPWSRWITPRQPSVTNKRFDTRFFITRVDPMQDARHDDHETTDSVWLTPQQALQRFAQGDIELAPPQIMSLMDLKLHASVDAALTHARQRQPVLIEPEPFDEDGCRVICYPGDPRHGVPQKHLNGPTRLKFESGHFVPIEGMHVLLE